MSAANVVPGPWAGQAAPAASAEDAGFDAEIPPAPPEDEEGHGGGGGGSGDGERTEAEDFGPVVPLGVVTHNRVTRFLLLDAAGRETMLSARDISNRDCLYAVFGGERGLGFLLKHFPRLVEVKDPESGEVEIKQSGWMARDVGGRLVSACTRIGDAEAVERRRDGVWRGAEGGLVVHTGSKLHLAPEGRTILAGRMHGGMLYLRSNLTAEPAAKAATAAECQALAEKFKLWLFHPDDAPSAPTLLMGMVACGTYAGALNWRPHMWLRGESNAGKSTLLDLLTAATGTEVRMKGVSEPYVRRKYDARPKLVVLDEQEPDLAGVSAILVLMRGASEPGGGVGKVIDGQAKEYQFDSPVLLAAISTPKFDAQDASRITTLRLKRQGGDRRAKLVEAKALAGEMQRAILTRLMLGWARFQYNLLVYRDALMARDATSRCADQLAALLAGNRVLVDDMPIDATAAAEELDVLELRPVTPEEAAEGDSSTECLGRLLSSRVPVGLRNESMTVAALVEKLRGAHAAEARARQLGDPGMLMESGKALKAWVRRAGALKLRWSPGEGLVVGNGQPLLDRCFDGTPWEHRVWEQQLRDLAGARDAGSVNFTGAPKSRAVLVPEAVLGLEEDDGPAPEPPPD